MGYCNILSFIIWLPIFMGVGSLMANPKYCRYLVKIVALINFGISIYILKDFYTKSPGMHLIEYYKLLPLLEINYALGIDGVSILYLSISSMVFFLISYSYNLVNTSSKEMLGFILILHGLANGAILSTNIGLFYIFFEIMFICLSFWLYHAGLKLDGIKIGLKFLSYNLVGSGLMLFAIVYLRNIASSQGVATEKLLEFAAFYKLSLSFSQQLTLFLAVISSIAIKIPIVPLHHYLTDRLSKLPDIIGVFAIAVCFKLSSMILYKLVLLIAPQASVYCSKYMVSIGLMSIIYIGVVMLKQQNFKKIIGYIAIIQMNLVMLGMFIAMGLIKQDPKLAIDSLNGSIILVLSHSLIMVGLYLTMVNNLSLDSSKLSWLFKLSSFFILANIGIPGTYSFCAEFLFGIASFKLSSTLGVLFFISIITTFIYILQLQRNIAYTTMVQPKPEKVFDNFLNNQFLILGMIAVMILILGVYPKCCHKIIYNEIKRFIMRME